jgi:3-hydroxyisobutyrate dehydrogenase-like beta-hydroxyacid dehydrogenase
MRTDQDPSARPEALSAVALLGFGEAGYALTEGWRSVDPTLILTAYDIKTANPDTPDAAAMWDRYDAADVRGAETIGAALAEARAVFSVVTADRAHDAARAAATVMAPGTLYLDANSCAPETKRASAKVIEAAGLRYVDTAIMSPIRPKLHRAPMLVSGPHAAAAAELMGTLGMDARVVAGEVGRASSIKMLRSVMIKGIEALTLECLLAARQAGVDDEVIASLDASMPGWDWGAKAAYNMERTTTHGLRRAAEMHEVARTVSDLGVPARMAAATTEWQHEMGSLGLPPGPETYHDRADAIIAALRNAKLEEST